MKRDISKLFGVRGSLDLVSSLESPDKFAAFLALGLLFFFLTSPSFSDLSTFISSSIATEDVTVSLEEMPFTLASLLSTATAATE